MVAPLVKTTGFWLKETVNEPMVIAESVAVPANPLRLVNVTSAVPVVPAWTLTLVGLTEKPKS